MTETVTGEQLIRRPPEAVWQALTTADGIARWWRPCDVRAEPGHRFEMDMGQWGQQHCEVLEVVPCRRFVMAFADWRLVWTLQAVPEGTLLRLDHEGFDQANPTHRYAFREMGEGWKSAVLPRLAAVVEGRAQAVS